MPDARVASLAAALFALTLPAGAPPAQAADAEAGRPHNLLIFVADGMRSGSVTPSLTPTFDRVRTQGVFFANSHALFPTFTMPNASAIATGHLLGDTGTFSNTLYTGYPQPFANGSVTPFIENDQVLGDIDSHFEGLGATGSGAGGAGYIDEETVLAAARAAGLRTAAIGKLGPATLQDHANSALLGAGDRDARGTPTIIVDDRTGSPAGVPLDPGFTAALSAAGLPTAAPSRGGNGVAGNSTTPGTLVPNSFQQDYFAAVATTVVLPQFKAAGAPFAMVFWSRDPDGTQHNQGDSLNTVLPGIDGPTSHAALANADSDLARLLAALDRLGLTASTNVIVTADHGFSTISKTPGPGGSPSATSFAATRTYQTYRNGALAQDVPPGFLPPGFVAIDLAHALNLPLVDPDAAPAGAPKPVTPTAYPPVDPTQPPAADGGRLQRPMAGNGVIGADPARPDVVVAANGGSDLVYLPNPDSAADFAPRVVAALLAQDYVSGLFVDDRLGPIPGTLPLSAIGLQGSALTPIPSIVINFASTSTRGQGCPHDTDAMCAVEVADTGLQQGQGMHGSFSRGDTHNFMAAIGPDFRAGLRDPAPASNADVGKTAAALLRLDIPAIGRLTGRVLTEALATGGGLPAFERYTLRSDPARDGRRTVLRGERVGETRYFDAAGFPGSTIGVEE